MRKCNIVAISLFLWLLSCSIYAQDTVFNRVVTVERDYKPELKDAKAVVTKPVFIQYEPEPNPVVYSTYSELLSVGHNVCTLPAYETHFRSVEVNNAVLDGAIGHRNTHLQFAYNLMQQDNNSLNLFVNHNAYWGNDALSQSALGAEYIRHLPKAELFVGIDGVNEAYAYQPLMDWRTFCIANAKVGFRSLSNYPFQFRVQTGYTVFALPNILVEHHAKSHVDLWWTDQRHSAGLKGYVQNSFCTQLDASAMVLPKHNIRLQPFYSYLDQHIRLHAGVNLDMNIGTATMLSTIDNLSFAPSPNVEFEWHTLKNLLHVYTQAKGSFGLGSMEEYIGYNRYLNVHQGVDCTTPRAYTPVDAKAGVKVRPIKTLLVDVYAGYAYMMNACNMRAILHEDALDYQLWFTDYQYWTAGAKLHYHYRDILELNLEGNHYFYKEKPYDRPVWDVHARVDVHVNSQISIYSDNHFAGSRLAATSDGDMIIKPMISLNLGAQYDINSSLSAYLQLNDYLNRRDEFFYGYKSQGTHFLLGVKYRF